MKGTIFEGSALPLTKWFRGVSLFWLSAQAISAKELQRQLDVTYPTAWRMIQKLRCVEESLPAKSKRPSIDQFLAICSQPDGYPRWFPFAWKN